LRYSASNPLCAMPAATFGAIEPLEYVISVDGLDGAHAAPAGNVHAVAAELHEMNKATNELNEIIRSASLEPLGSREHACNW
jgi:hypothetical protein